MTRSLVLVLVLTAIAPAHADDRYDDGALGALAFTVSEGTPQARAHFMRGMLALHSFWYDEAKREFEAAMTADPSMNMAHWGVAMSECKLLWGDDDVDAAKHVIASMPDPGKLTPREQGWVLALIALLKATDVRDSRKQFAAAMEALYARFPDDESATFLALALLAASRPEDPDQLVVRLRAGALALGVYRHNPKHPGAAHYLIHAYDVPELAPLALPFANTYAKLAPAAFHARHMPAHIYSRLGMWKEAVTSCQAAWDASVASAQRDKLGPDHDDFHSLNWIIEMSFELGHRNDADRAMATFGKAIRAGVGHQTRAAYAGQVASYLARTGQWSRVDELLAPLQAAAVEEAAGGTRADAVHAHCAPAQPGSPTAALEQFAVVDARVRAASALHDRAKVERLLGELDRARRELQPYMQAMQPKEILAKLDEAYARGRAVLIARASGDDRALLKVLQAAAGDGEQQTAGELNPNGYLVREDIADTLLRLGRAKEAAAQYALALAHHPGRAHALLGEARAATKAGDAAAARALYAQLVQTWSTADDGTDGLAEARAAVTGP